MTLLDWLSWEPPRGGPPSVVAALAAGCDMVGEMDPGSGEPVRVLVIDRSGLVVDGAADDGGEGGS